MHETQTWKRDLLARISPFSACSDRQLDELAGLADEHHVEAGTVLCRQGEIGAETYVIVDGEFGVWVDEREVARLSAGEVVCEQALFHDGRRNATVRAFSAGTLLAIDPRDIDSMLAAVPTAARGYGARP
jgi:CRP-like cAMP-binding protein